MHIFDCAISVVCTNVIRFLTVRRTWLLGLLKHVTNRLVLFGLKLHLLFSTFRSSHWVVRHLGIVSMEIRRSALYLQIIFGGNDIIRVHFNHYSVHSRALCSNMSSNQSTDFIKPITCNKNGVLHLGDIVLICLTLPHTYTGIPVCHYKWNGNSGIITV